MSTQGVGNSGEERMGGISQGRSDIKMLAEMVNRGRRRTRYTHRASTTGGEPSSSNPGLSVASTVSSTAAAEVTYLPRGGVHVKTKYGAVQFGLPPETIKDSRQLQLEVPGIFVVRHLQRCTRHGVQGCARGAVGALHRCLADRLAPGRLRRRPPAARQPDTLIRRLRVLIRQLIRTSECVLAS